MSNELKLNSKVTLNNGVQMPWLGLGVFLAKEGTEVVQTVKAALKYGYLSIDTAAAYNNEEGVGRAIAESIAEGTVAREDIFVTSKVWNSNQGYDSTLAAFNESLYKLNLDYLDLYLVHWPVKGKYKETWRALEKVYAEGKVKAIGVSNFQVHHLDDLLQDATVVPAVNQIELHPLLAQQQLRDYCKSKNIQVEAWSPLGQGNLLDHELLKKIAAKHGKTTAQIILRWDIELGVVTIPKSVKEHRIIENANIFDFQLDAEDIAAIATLNENKRFGSDPDNFNF
ncbi:diketogulonate reductase-like aldo/keto reductase [Paenibacillus turicensis]|uniref:Diketogulonate reductase-like aldo/keto reductase n=1 Tax=Paenibacillus turicensis TaxID=160487 RepID=A0ABS4FND7_9BACL|nr:aldo/keto reductase [Paenibacillus turicensis]MBP1904051.1 diketogulonate reductase-like aldo/keto reductase [Paenibacillus turicensis]